MSKLFGATYVLALIICWTMFSGGAVAVQDSDDLLTLPFEIPHTTKDAQQLALKIELAVVRSELDLSNEQMKEFESIESLVQTQASKLDSEMGYLTPLAMRVLGSDLQEKVWEKAEQLEIGEKGVSFEEFKQSSLQLDELRDSNGQRTLIYYLDESLSFSQSQVERLAPLLKEHWASSYWNNQVAMSVWNDFDYVEKIVNDLREDVFENVLSDEQLETLSRLSEFDRGFELFESDFSEEALRDQMTMRLGLHLTEMTSVLSLDEKQLRILEVARKGVVNKCVKEWSAAEEKRSPGAPEGEYYDLCSEPLIDQCLRKSIWHKTVQKVLTDEQKEKWDSRMLNRRRYRLRCNCEMQVLFQEIGLNFSESIALIDLYVTSLESTAKTQYDEIRPQLLEIPNEEIQEVLREKVWNRLKVLRDRMR